MPAAKLGARQHILEVAGRLFFREGYRAVGIDTIVAESGVAKMTLYRHFPSKDDLIVAYLEETNERFWAWFERSIAEQTTPRAQLSALFEALATLVSSPQCHGCPFLNAAGEFPQLDHPGHRTALAHKQAVRARLLQMTTASQARQPEILADQLAVLMDGAYLQVRMFGLDNPAKWVAEAAKTLIAQQHA